MLPAGTINIAVFTNANLSPTLPKVETLQIIAEAKGRFACRIQQRHPQSPIWRPGTGTDSTAVFSDPEGVPIDYYGKHVVMGEIVGGLVWRRQEGIAACQSVSARGSVANISIDSVVRSAHEQILPVFWAAHGWR